MAKEAKSPEELKERIGKNKAKLVEAKEELAGFLKKNKLKKGEDHSNHEDKKIASGFTKRKAEIDEIQGRIDKNTAALKEAKKSGNGGGKAKYAYPADVKDSGEKKKFRAEVRAKAKKAGVSVDDYLKDPAKYAKAVKAEKKEKKAEKKADKPAKKEKKTEAPAEEPAKKKKKKVETSTETMAKED